MQDAIEHFSQSNYNVFPLSTEKGRNKLMTSIMPLGATIQKIAFLDEWGRETSLALGFPDPVHYKSLICYAGATLGPNAGRIRDGRLSLPGAEHSLTPNDGRHQLHGGAHNLSSQLWTVEDFTFGTDTSSILLSTDQPHGLDGWPGNRSYQVHYTLTDDDRLTIEYEARTDQPTYFNLSNHTYWDLSGRFTSSALEQELTIHASRVCANDGDHLPVGLISVDGTAFDFQAGRSLCQALNSAQNPVVQEQFAIAQGFNHAYLLDGPSELKRACVLRDPRSRREVEVWTDAPGMVLYSGGFLPDGLALHGDCRSVPSCAIALEAQDLPNCSRLCPEAFRPTMPGEVWRRIIQFRFHLPQP